MLESTPFGASPTHTLHEAEPQTQILLTIETEKVKNNRRRSRKSKLYEEICKQMEFYFSDANLTKQRVMMEIVNTSEYVPLSLFLEKFNKISQLCKNVEEIRRALKKSDHLILSQEGSGVKRRIPFEESKVKDEETVENSTIYVENIPTHVNHDWIEKIFQEFGQVAYVSLPKFKRSKQPKGFAFVEFQEEEAAKRCLEAYGEIGGCLPTNIDPSSLMSISTFNEEKEKEKEGGGNRRKRTTIQASLSREPDEEIKKKPKLEEEKEKTTIKLPKQLKGHEIEKKIDTDEVFPSASANETEQKDTTTKTEKKKKRRKHTNKHVPVSEEKLESDLIHLRILPKRNWRQLRNRYLNLQRENFSKLKSQMRSSGNRRYYEPHHTSTGQFKSLCIKLTLSSPPESKQALWDQISEDLVSHESPNFLKYVDYEENGFAVVRVDGGPRARFAVDYFLDKAKGKFKDATLMSEKETDEYWAASKAKLKEKKKEKTRGKDRLLNQATKFATSHIHFEDSEEK